MKGTKITNQGEGKLNVGEIVENRRDDKVGRVVVMRQGGRYDVKLLREGNQRRHA